MLHFYDGTITRYKGDYDTFEATRSEQLKQQALTTLTRTLTLTLALTP